MKFLFNPADSAFTVVVADGFYALPQEETLPINLEYIFDYHLHCVSVGSQSQYDRLAKQLLRQGLIKRLPDRQYFEEIAKGVRYWNGDDSFTEMLR